MMAQKDSGFDFLVSDQGTIVLLTPVSDAAHEWVDENIDPEAVHYGPAIVIEHRYAQAIIEGINEAGMTGRLI